MGALAGAFRGQLDLIYIDPPFASGVDHPMDIPLAGGRVRTDGYGDRWRAGDYLQMMYERLIWMHDLLHAEGSLLLHCDWHMAHRLRALLDEVFGPEAFVNEIVWHYYNKYSAGKRSLPRAHDTIFWYSKSGQHTLNPLREAREKPARQLVRESVGGVLKNARDAKGALRYREVHDRKVDDVWRIPQLQPASREWTGYRTQKHHDLLERLIGLCTHEGGWVADFFCGSGTTMAVAERMGRRWLGVDGGRAALHTTRKRLITQALALREGALGEDAAGAGAGQDATPGDWAREGRGREGGVRPFDVCELGAGERGLWLERRFGGDVAACRAWLAQGLGLKQGVGRGLAKGPPEDGAPFHGTVDGWVVHLAHPGASMQLPGAEELLVAAQAAGHTALALVAWDYAPALRAGWEGLEQRYGMRLALVQPPREVMLAPNAELGGFSLLPRLRAGLEEVDGRRQVRLVAFRPSAPFPPEVGGGAGMANGRESGPPGEEGLGFVDVWSIQPGWQDGALLAPTWHGIRPLKRGEIPLATELSPPGEGGASTPVLVRATDLWGYEACAFAE